MLAPNIGHIHQEVISPKPGSVKFEVSNFLTEGISPESRNKGLWSELSFVNFLTVTKGNGASQQGDIKTLSSFSKVGQTYLLDEVTPSHMDFSKHHGIDNIIE
jgi:hypothetical protein